MHFMLPVCGGPQRRSEGGAKIQFSCGHLTWMTPMFQDTREQVVMQQPNQKHSMED